MEPKSLADGRVSLWHADMLDALDAMPENSVDAVCTDPPYHLLSIVKRFGGKNAKPNQHGTDGAFARMSKGFMGHTWDGGDIAFRPETWAKVFRVLKPGGYILAFSSSRTFGRMQVAMEDAGFTTHPMIGRLFDPSDDVAALIDSFTPVQLDAFVRVMERADPVAAMLAWVFGQGAGKATKVKGVPGYEGWGYGTQSLKPALEPVYMGQKPFSERTGSANIARWGTGAVNIDGCRVEASAEDIAAAAVPNPMQNSPTGKVYGFKAGEGRDGTIHDMSKGRYPANLVHDGSDAVEASFAAYGERESGTGAVRRQEGHFGIGDARHGGIGKVGDVQACHGDTGSISRYYYSAKADAEDRVYSGHPTVKPVELIRYFIRLITPSGGTVLDCFAGSGTAGQAAIMEGMNAVLVERDDTYIPDIERRFTVGWVGKLSKDPVTAALQTGSIFDFCSDDAA